jgi:hypothetical protein
MTCGILALTLLSLAQRVEVAEITAGYAPFAQPAEAPRIDAREPVIQPTLTRAQTDFR